MRSCSICESVDYSRLADPNLGLIANDFTNRTATTMRTSEDTARN